ncbi:unnamed protein product, partial [Ectocarpus fasciculatus]
LKASAWETEAALFQRRQEMDQEWDDIEKGRQALLAQMTK